MYLTLHIYKGVAALLIAHQCKYVSNNPKNKPSE